MGVKLVRRADAVDASLRRLDGDEPDFCDLFALAFVAVGVLAAALLVAFLAAGDGDTAAVLEPVRPLLGLVEDLGVVLGDFAEDLEVGVRLDPFFGVVPCVRLD